MSFARLHKSIAYLIAGLGLASLAIGSELSIGAGALIAIGFVASAFVEGPILTDPRWARGWTVALVVLFALQVGRALLGAPILPLILELVAALQISRLMSRRGAREHQQIAALALLHLIAATLLSTDLAYAFAFLGFVVALPWMLALSHLRAEIESQLADREAQRRDAAAQRSEPGDREGSLSRVLGSKDLVGPGFLAGTAALAIPLFALTGLVFVAFPRVGLGFLSFGRDTGQRTSGFGSNIELGDFGVIRTDPTVVLRVVPPDLPVRPPPLRTIRMRGTSFDHYDGRRWTRSRDLGARGVGRIDALYAVPSRLPVPARDAPWSIVLDALDEPVLFLPPGTVGIEVPPRMTGGVESGREILYTPGVDVRYADGDGLGLRYVAWTNDEQGAAHALDPADARRYLQVPEAHERVAALAREWTEGAEDDAERVRMLLEHLRDADQYRYSLETPRLGERVPLDVFLFEAKRGHCEYFATALAIQLRTLGIPARNVAGFLGGRFNPYGGYYALSQGDAHSWVEAWLPGRGWITLDPTPPSRDTIGIDEGPLGELREMMDALRTRWAEHIVGYDLQRQVGLFRGIRRWFRGSGASERAAPEPGASLEPAGAPGWAWALFVVIGIGALAVWLRRRRRSKVEPEGAVLLYRALELALAKAGHPRPPARTPLEHVAHLEREGFSAIELVRDITERYLSARYGGTPLEPGELERLRARVKTLARPKR